MSWMCSEPGLYEITAELQALGIADEETARYEVLSRAVTRSEVPPHLQDCAYCAALYASLQRMQGIAKPATDEEVVIARCPDAATLSAYHYGDVRGRAGEAMQEHLRECPECRHDLAFLSRSQEPREKVAPFQRRLFLMAIAAAALIASILPWPWNRKTEKPVEKANFTQSSRYASLAQVPLAVNRAEMLRDSPAAHHPQLNQVLAAYEKGDYKKAGEYAQIIVDAVEDPSAQYLLAMAQFQQKQTMQAFISMKVSERMEPQTAYRCWATLQMALLVGDKNTAVQEAHHAANEGDYGPRCNQILSKL